MQQFKDYRNKSENSSILFVPGMILAMVGYAISPIKKAKKFINPEEEIREQIKKQKTI